MIDITADLLLEATLLQFELLRRLTTHAVAPDAPFDWRDIENRSRRMMDKLEALQKVRKGRE